MENENQTPVEEKKGLSIASMVLGLVGLFLFAIPCGILAIIFSLIGKKKGGKGFATAGLILGIVDVAWGLFAVVTTFSAFSALF